MAILIHFLLVFIPHAASITLNHTQIGTQNLSTDIVATGDNFEKTTVKSWSFNSSDLKVNEEMEQPPLASPIHISQPPFAAVKYMSPPLFADPPEPMSPPLFGSPPEPMLPPLFGSPPEPMSPPYAAGPDEYVSQPPYAAGPDEYVSQPPYAAGPEYILQPSQGGPINTIEITNSFRKKIRAGQIAGIIAGILVVLACIAIFAFFLWRRKTNKGEATEEVACDVEMDKNFEVGPKRFSYHEIVQATSSFVETNKLGEGGFGGVYKGFLKNLGTYIAVKRVSKTSGQGIKEYMSEVKIISRLRHKNLVELMGWCHEKNELLLIYEFMENGSLDFHLFNEKSLLTWDIRYKIAHGLASALIYLQEDCKECVLHRDIKSSNVMLDSNFNAKLGDFGLAKLVDHEKGSRTTMLAGTVGYMAPEYVMAGKASKESDIFSFGIVALEIACGRESIKNKAEERERKLLEWVWDLYGSNALLEAVDPRLGSGFEEEELKRLMIVGLWCAHPNAASRPSMRQAIQVLKFEASLPMLPSKIPMLAFSEPPILSSYGGTSSSGSNTRSSKLTTSSSCSSSPSALLFNQM